MRIDLKTPDGETIALQEPYQSAPCAIPQIDGPECPACGEALRVRCPNYETTGATAAGAAVCGVCDAHVGQLTITFNTIFGQEEDQRVLNGRCRVYGSARSPAGPKPHSCCTLCADEGVKTRAITEMQVIGDAFQPVCKTHRDTIRARGRK